MPATEVNQFFFEAKPLWVGKVGAAGVASAAATTIPAQSAVGLTEGNAYVITINRVNAAGTVKNPANQRETFIGKLSGSNFINCVRQVEGEAQAWEADTVMEVLITATMWNKMIEGIEDAVGSITDKVDSSVFEEEHDSNGEHNIPAMIANGSVTDEDDMASNSDGAVPTQQSVKAYVDNKDSLQTIPAPAANTSASGIKVALTAAENLGFGDVGYINSNGKVAKADADAIATSSAVVMALASISTDASGQFLMIGYARNDAWAWTPGGLIYLSTTAGLPTQAAPTATDDVIQILGVATHADRMLFSPNLAQVEHT